MQKKMKMKLLAFLMSTVSIYGVNCMDNMVFAATTGNETNGKIEINDSYGGDAWDKVAGYYNEGKNAENGQVMISGGTIGYVYGGYSWAQKGPITLNSKNNEVIITGGTIHSASSSKYAVYGGYASRGSAIENKVTISGGTIGKGSSATGITRIYGGYGESGDAIGNIVKISGTNTNINAGIYGGGSMQEAAKNNTVIINGGNITTGLDYIIGGEAGPGTDGQKDISISDNNKVEINGGIIKTDTIIGGKGYTSKNNKVTVTAGTFNEDSKNKKTNIYGGYSDSHEADVRNNTVEISGDVELGNIYGGFVEQNTGIITDNVVKINKGKVENVYGAKTSNGTLKGNEVTVTGGIVTNSVYGAYTTDKGNIVDNVVDIQGGQIDGNIYGAYRSSSAKSNDELTNNIVKLQGGKLAGKIYAAYSNYSPDNKISDNKIIVTKNVDLSNVELYGYGEGKHTIGNPITSNNRLVIDNWKGNVKSVANFSDIDFNNINFKNGATVLKITEDANKSLANTNINLNSLTFNGGSEIKENDSMTFIEGTNLGINENKVNMSKNFTAGVATIGKGNYIIDNNGNLIYKVEDVNINSQIGLVSENRAISAAFINQGSDLIEKGLKNLSDQYGYGMKTFAAVYGNRSTYDVNSDLKINGWSEILGIGETKKLHDGDFSYGMFFENGSGNYRTYNSFNNEFFRGDGNLVYNGGGIAGRWQKDNGWYYEGSLHAGTLKSEMDNALKDGKGNTYGYESDNLYYGAHIGIGKKVDLDKDKEVDIYGKFFHTYNEGDSFLVDKDKFNFDDLTSDRLKVGVEYTVNKENKWHNNYGLSYEYEFNGDSDMSVGQFHLPTQSLQGGTIIGEIGLSYQDSKSPWMFDINITGYQGQRDGFSGNAQITYNF